MTPPPPPPSRCRRLTAGGVTAHLFLLLVLPLSAANVEKSRNFSSPSFSEADRPNLYILGNSNIGLGALQLTPDTRNDQSFLVNKSGRILLRDRIKLWTSDRLLSFNTTILVNVYRINNTVPGEGLAFVIVPDTSDPPPGSHGGYLGLTNAATDGNSSNHFIAVELDTYRQDYDIDNNHIGLNINSVHSNASVSLSDVGITISPLDGASRLVWIDYDGEAKFIRIYVANESSPKPKLAVLAVPLDLRQHLLRDSYFGFAGSTGANIELNCVKSWNLTYTDLSDHGMEAWKLAVAITVPLLVLLIFCGLLTWWICARRRRSRYSPRVVSTLRSLPGMPRQFEFKDLKRATNNFDEKLKLGQGGFGVVYKGVVDDGTEVAIKKFSRDRMNSQEDFLSELSIINRLRHKHLVRLSGWCHKNEILLLVYDYMPNGSLDQHIYGERPLLTWERRYNAIAGLASALHYLHHEYDERVVHRDLKASNVMLDGGYNARLGDFGLARALETDKTSYADIELGGVPGTLGYIAPECFHTGKATRESDVYGFGTVVLEVACGRRPRCEVGGFSYLADWVWKLHRERRIVDAVDERLAGKYAAAEAERLLVLGLACCHPLPKERPRMTEVVQVVAGAVAPPVVPAFKPAFVWPSATDEEEGTSGLTSTAVTSSCYASSAAEWTPRFLSEDVLGRAGGDGDVASGPGK